ncbi:hypothetical protein B5M09_006826 [Aphanomyces astaci]|uniref:Uncharacterized protein n=1 Tax=Aphanomyces astaci TaxID=112090 RepID=A0A3R7WJN4_APHAT|nr:hypothetical protein B5M09_006826 [Aphanomyces astaci]
MLDAPTCLRSGFILSLSFLLIFTAYSATERHGRSISSTAVFALANLVVALNPTNVVLQWGIMLPTAVLGGVAASFLWISQASYLTRLSVLYSQFKRVPAIASVGLFNGIFLSSTVNLFWIYTATSVAGTALLCLIPDLPLQAAAPLPTEYTKLLEPDSAVATMRSLAALAMDRCIYPFIRFLSGEFTSNVVRESLGSAAIGTVFAVVGLVSVSSSFVFGKLADKYNLLMEITWVDDFTTDLAPCPGNS